MSDASPAIILVNYRSCRMVLECLASIRRATGTIAECGITVVDNDSGDDCMRELEGSLTASGWGDRVRLVASGRNAGFGAGNNLGFRHAAAGGTPDLIWFLNPDTVVNATDLSNALTWFRSDPHVAVVGTGLDDGEGNPDLGGHRDPSALGEFAQQLGTPRILRRFAVSDPELERPGIVDWVSGASMIVRADVFRAIGGFDEGFFLYFEEVDLCRRIRSAGYKVVYEPRSRVVHLEGQVTGVTGTKPKPRYWYESRRRFFVKHYGRWGLLAADFCLSAGSIVAKCVGRKRRDGLCLREVWTIDRPAVLGTLRIE